MPGIRKLNLPTDQRVAMLRSLVTNLFKSGKIQTTVTRAKEAQKIAEKMITLAKKNTLASRRQVLEFIYEESVVAKLFAEIAPKCAERNGGYTAIYRLGPRRGDAAEMALLVLIDAEDKKDKKSAKKSDDKKTTEKKTTKKADKSEKPAKASKADKAEKEEKKPAAKKPAAKKTTKKAEAKTEETSEAKAEAKAEAAEEKTE